MPRSEDAHRYPIMPKLSDIQQIRQFTHNPLTSSKEVILMNGYVSNKRKDLVSVKFLGGKSSIYSFIYKLR